MAGTEHLGWGCPHSRFAGLMRPLVSGDTGFETHWCYCSATRGCIAACVCAVQAEQRELGQQLMQQLEQLHRAVQAGVAVDPVVLAASAGAAASTAPGLTPPHAAAAVGHPAVAASFLQDLAAFGKGAAAGVTPLSVLGVVDAACCSLPLLSMAAAGVVCKPRFWPDTVLGCQSLSLSCH